MTISRRDFVKVGAAAASLVALPRGLRAATTPNRPPLLAGADPDRRALALRAVDAAKSAGASYADVRLTHNWLRRFGDKDFGDAESMEVGVRALVQGYWGFASGPVWSPDEMVRLGREAVHQAKTNALGKTRAVNLAPVPAVPNGDWTMPVEIDPFEISPYEIVDYLRGLAIYAANLKRGTGVEYIDATFAKQEKAFASSEGSFCTQRLYSGAGDFRLSFEKDRRKDQMDVDLLTVAGLGWELYTGQPIREEVRKVIDRMEADMKLLKKPVDVGRFDTVVDARGVSMLADMTLGRATELDRALGYEANAGGTSYMNAPFDMIGSYQAGAPSLTLSAERSSSGGAASVKWDDEGVVPDEFTIVKDGVLSDFQTTRESAGWLEPYYSRSNRPMRSHGCANSDSAIDAPLQHSPNLVLHPGREALDFNGLVAGMVDGIAITNMSATLDFQHLNGLTSGRVYEVKKGKIVSMIDGGGVLFRAPELWKGLHALGGAASSRRFGSFSAKGEPAQATCHSVTAVPAVFKQLTLIDPQRKA
jgi:TldD protein